MEKRRKVVPIYFFLPLDKRQQIVEAHEKLPFLGHDIPFRIKFQTSLHRGIFTSNAILVLINIDIFGMSIDEKKSTREKIPMIWRRAV